MRHTGSRVDGHSRIAALMTAFVLMSGQATPLAIVGDGQSRIELGLDDVRRMAIEASDELRQAELETRIAAAKWEWGVRALLPELGLSGTGDERVMFGGPDSASKRFGLNLGFTVFDGGKSLFQREMAAIQLALAERELERKRKEVSNKAASMYYSIVTGEKKLAITRELVALSAQQEAIARKELELGKITEIDLLEISTSVLQAEIDLALAEFEMEDSYYELKRALKIDQAIQVVLTGEVDPAYDGIDLEEKGERFAARAVSRSLELEKARLELVATQKQLEFAKNSWIPTVSLSITCSVSGERFPLDSLSYGFSLSISFPDPLFPLALEAGAQGGSRGEVAVNQSVKTDVAKSPAAFLDVRSAELQLQYKQEAYVRAAEDLEKAMERMLRKYANLRESKRLIGKKVVLAEKKRDIALKKTELGQVTRKEYVVAETELAKARIELFAGWLSLRAAEWEFESVLWLEPGSLRSFAEAE